MSNDDLEQKILLLEEKVKMLIQFHHGDTRSMRVHHSHWINGTTTSPIWGLTKPQLEAVSGKYEND